MPGNHGNNPELFTRIGLVPTVEASGTELAVSIPERAAHFIEALNHLDAAVLVEGDIAMYRDEAWRSSEVKRYGASVVYGMQGRKYQRHREILDAVRGEFDAAYGLHIIRASILHGPLSGEEKAEQLALVQTDVDAQYQDFEQRYRGSSDMRMNKRYEFGQHFRRQLMGQMAVEESVVSRAEVDPKPLQPNSKISLSRALRPSFLYEFLGRHEADYDAISDMDMRRVHPKFLRPALINVKANTKNALAQYGDRGQAGKIYTVFTPYEQPNLLRTDSHYPAQVAENRSETTQHELPIDEHDPDAPRRARIHINERIDVWMQDYVANRIDPSLNLIERLREASQYNGNLARFGNVQNMQTQLQYFWDNIVGDMLWAVRVSTKQNRIWEEDRRLALEKAVYFAGTSKGSLDNLGLVLDVAEEWLNAKRAYIMGRSAEIHRFIYDHETPTERRERAERLLQPD